jgi:hypothetical protein
LTYKLEWKCPRPEINPIDRHARLCSPIQRPEEKEQRAHVEEGGEEEGGDYQSEKRTRLQPATIQAACLLKAWWHDEVLGFDSVLSITLDPDDSEQDSEGSGAGEDGEDDEEGGDGEEGGDDEEGEHDEEGGDGEDGRG